MNILFFLTPKSDVAHIYDDDSLDVILSKMEQFQYTAVPIIDRKGHYIGTMTEGDVFWYIKKQALNDNALKKRTAKDVEHRIQNQAVSVNVNMEDLVAAAMNQNFVPVVDDDDIFIGIVTRKDIIDYCYQQMKKAQV